MANFDKIIKEWLSYLAFLHSWHPSCPDPNDAPVVSQTYFFQRVTLTVSPILSCILGSSVQGGLEAILQPMDQNGNQAPEYSLAILKRKNSLV